MSSSPPASPPAALASGRYTGVAQALHWIVAALAAAVLPLAWTMTALPEGKPLGRTLFFFHSSVGLTIGLLMLARVLWRLGHPAPPYGRTTAGWLRAAAVASHGVLYLVFLAMPVSGYVMAAASGGPVSLWGLPLPQLAKNEALAKLADESHALGAWVVYALVLLHVAATAWHVAALRDGVLQRMTPPQVNADRA